MWTKRKSCLLKNSIRNSINRHCEYTHLYLRQLQFHSNKRFSTSPHMVLGSAKGDDITIRIGRNSSKNGSSQNPAVKERLIITNAR